MKTIRKALLVGIDDYPNAPLSNCARDATAIHDLLKTEDDDSPNFLAKLHLNVPTKAKLKQLIAEAFSGTNDTALFYFSGHGIINDVGGYIVTPDYQSFDEGVSMEEILRIVNESKSINRIVILDCCHSGAFGNPSTAGGQTAQIKEGVTILTSSRENEASFEGIQHSVFTSLLLEALRGGAADLAGYITPGGIYAFIDQALGHWGQRPQFKTNVSRFAPLRQVHPQVSIEILRKIVTYYPKPNQAFFLDPSFEDTNSHDIVHEVIEPYAQPDHVAIFKDLQKLQSIGLVTPVEEDHMYFAAMKSKSCKLTPLGQHYWRLIKDNLI